MIVQGLSLALLAFVGQGHASLPVLKNLPAFRLQQSNGRTFGTQDLRGKVWVADFIFTRCHGQCPLLSRKMEALQDLYAQNPDFRLVSFTVDPQNDTPTALARYAKRYHAKEIWSFLTGKKSKLRSLIQEGFQLAGGGDEIAHSFRFALVDRQHRIRGYYAVSDSEAFEQLKHDLNALLVAD